MHACMGLISFWDIWLECVIAGVEVLFVLRLVFLFLSVVHIPGLLHSASMAMAIYRSSILAGLFAAPLNHILVVKGRSSLSNEALHRIELQKPMIYTSNTNNPAETQTKGTHAAKPNPSRDSKASSQLPFVTSGIMSSGVSRNNLVETRAQRLGDIFVLVRKQGQRVGDIIPLSLCFTPRKASSEFV